MLEVRWGQDATKGLVDEDKHKLDVLSALNEAVAAVSSADSLPELHHLAAYWSARLTGAHKSIILVKNRRSAGKVSVASHGFLPEEAGRMSLPPGELDLLAGRLAAGQAHATADVAGDAIMSAWKEPAGQMGLRQAMAAPLLLGDRRSGVAAVFAPGGAPEFGPSEATALSILIRAVSSASARLGGAGARRRKAEDLHISLHRIGEALGASMELGRAFQLIVDTCVSVMEADGAVLQIVEPGFASPSTEAISGASGAALARLESEERDIFAGRLLQDGKPLQLYPVPEYLASQGRDEKAAGILNYLAVPMRLRGRVLGTLSVARIRPEPFSHSQSSLLMSFASQAVIAVENARLFSTLQKRLVEMSGLSDMSQTFASMTRLEDTYVQLMERIARLLDAERCAIMLPDAERRTLVAHAPAFGLNDANAASLVIPLDKPSASVHVFVTGEPYFTNDAQDDPRNLHKFALDFGDRSLLVVPMRVGDQTVGLLRASNKRGGEFTANDVRLAIIAASQAAVAVRNAVLYQEVTTERERLEAIFSVTSDGIVLIDPLRRIMDLNPAMEKLTGSRARDVIGMHCYEVFRSHDEKGVSLCAVDCPLLRCMSERISIPYVETIITTRDGIERDVAMSYSFVPAAGSLTDMYGVVIAKDISRAKELERTRTQMISTISHELRTPLASIKASIGVLLTSMPTETDEPLMRLLRNIERSTTRLEDIVGDVLECARLQSGGVSLSYIKTDLRQMVLDAAAMLKPLVQSKRQRLLLDVPGSPLVVSADRQRLDQVMLNLLSNAHKFTPDGGRISMAVREHERDVHISVSDTGPGIAPDQQEQIFERFYRLQGQEMGSSAGVGLGLPIARAIVELHGGRMWLESESGKGSTFWFSVPKGRNA